MRAACAAIVMAVASLSAPASASASVSADASGKGLTLAVPELDTPPTMMGLGGQLMKQVEAAAREQGFTVLTAQELETQLGRDEAERLRRCAGQPSCYVARLRPVGAQRAVVGSLSRDEKSYLVRLFLIDLTSGEVIADVDRSILIASRRLQQDVAEAVPRLLRGEREARGTLKVTSPVRGAEVLVDGRPVGTTPLELELKPGKYEVRLTKKHHLPVRRLVDVFADRVTEEEIRLLREPGAPPDPEELPPLVATKAAGASDGFAVRAPAWVALGTGLALGGVGGYFGLRSTRAEEALQNGFDTQRAVYGGTRLQAIQGHRDARTANLFFAGAAVAAATAVVLTVFDVGGPGEAKGATLQAAPSAGPGGAGVMLGGRF